MLHNTFLKVLMPTKKKSKKTAKSTKKSTSKSSTATKTASRKSVAKKSTARAAKKATRTKRAPANTKKTNKEVLICVDGEHCFWTNDGQILSSIADLRDALHRMNEEVFAHHVTREKNDFADWVEQVLHDAELSQALRRTKKPHTARAVVVRRLKAFDL